MASFLSNRFFNLSTKLSNPSISPDSFLARTNIPPPAKPANMSPADILSRTHEGVSGLHFRPCGCGLLRVQLLFEPAGL